MGGSEVFRSLQARSAERFTSSWIGERDSLVVVPEQGFYDDEAAVAAYLELRHLPVYSANLVMEEPAFLEEVGNLQGLRILDLGCGDGTFAATCVAGRCGSYLGIDSSEAMIGRAERTCAHEMTVQFQHGAIEDFSAAPGSADLVASRMALHYVGEMAPVLQRAHDALVPGGRLVASMVHPVITAQRALSPDRRTSIVVDDYFSSGPRNRVWFNRPVTWWHRTIEQYVGLLAEAGFNLVQLRECSPVEEFFEGNTEEFERRKRVPVVLLLHAQKPTAT